MSIKQAESRARRHVADVLYDAASRVATSNAVESALDDSPALSLYTFVTSSMTIGSRVIKMGKFELGVAQVMSWQRPASTLTMLFAYSTLCYYPQWIVMVPLFYFSFFVLVPNYASKFKIDEESSVIDSEPLLLASNSSEEEKQKNSKTLLTAIKQGQKTSTGIVQTLDRIDEFRAGPARFADAQVSSMMLASSCILSFFSVWALTFVSIPAFFSFSGWASVCSKHPLAKLTSEKLEDLHIQPSVDIKVVYARLIDLCHKHVLLDQKPLRRVVEIFELQPQGLTVRQWDALSSVFSTSPYTSNSNARMNKDKPQGDSDICDVIPPDDWYFDSNDNWVRDEDASKWVSSDGVSQVEVDGPWAYDTSNEDSIWRRCRWTRYCYYDLK